MPALADLCADFTAECADLDPLVAELTSDEWRRPTPSPGWTVRDQIAHLAFGDDRARLAGSDPEEFERLRQIEYADQKRFQRAMVGEGLSADGHEVLAAWRRSRRELAEVFASLDPKIRVPWYGLPMSPASKVTARIMETWAHGQDIADTFGIVRTPTDRLRHVAHIGVGARRFSYMTNKLDPDDTPIRVELIGPSGDMWSWGDEGARDSVRGDAQAFCLVITQRRHLDDTDLEVRGDAATRWLAIGQAFAGPPGAGRTPGQFAR